MTGDAVRSKDSLDPAPWSLAVEGGHHRCAGWAFERRADQLQCVRDAARYEFSEMGRQYNRSATPPVCPAQKVTVDDPG
ncbi:MAG TPA: hypothetical protein VFZ97_19300 [Acidimicrobiales bacterium]